MNDMTVTSLFALSLGLIYLSLIVQVILQRRSKRIGFGDGDDKQMRGAIRAQVNAGEQIPIFLLLFALCEWRGAAEAWLILLGLIFVLGRLLNAYGMAGLVHRLRVLGTMLNLTGLSLTLATLAWTLI